MDISGLTTVIDERRRISKKAKAIREACLDEYRKGGFPVRGMEFRAWENESPITQAAWIAAAYKAEELANEHV